MKVAIPVFYNRVSPRFDFAPEMLIITTGRGGKESRRKRVDTLGWSVADRIRFLEREGVNSIICGGIDNFSHINLQMRGIKVYCWITGYVNDVLQMLATGKLEDGLMILPHGRCRRWRFCGPGGRWGRGWRYCM